jgi:hypothetical protein
MPLNLYETDIAYDIYDNPIELSPLKLKHYKKFMSIYLTLREKMKNEDEMIDTLSDCVVIAMKQYAPGRFNSYLDVQDNFDLDNMYKVINMAAGINDKDNKAKDQVEKIEKKTTWEDLDLVQLEVEVFLTGIWKNFDELEESISMPELFAILDAQRKQDYDSKKFLAAIQGIDLDKESGKSKGQKEWEDMKARVFSKGRATDSNDVLALQGINAQQAGFGIGMGLDYEDLRQT